jgi:hypothetical protein
MENSILKILNSEKARQLVNALILKNQEKAMEGRNQIRTVLRGTLPFQ